MLWRKFFMGVVGLGVASAAAPTLADSVLVDGGATSVLLDTDTLSSAASLTLSGVSSDVNAPGALGAPSVAFDINPRDATSLPTTFSYDPADFLGTFAGTIEHTGSVFFNAGSVEVGNFSIAFDANRAGTLGGNASGFFVESTTGLSAILFDIENPSLLSAAANSLQIGANLLVSPEFGDFLLTNSLSSVDLTGATVGQAQVDATAVPTPSAAAGAMIGLGILAARRRRDHN